MKPRFVAIILAALLTLAASDSSQARGKTPAYLIVRTPSRVHKGRMYHPARGYAVRTAPYAYGWFGAKPRRHWHRSTGYHSNYIQWTAR